MDFRARKIHHQSNPSNPGTKHLAEPWTDITTSTGRLMLAVLGGLADVGRDLIRTRTSEGRIRAIRQGKKWDVLVA